MTNKNPKISRWRNKEELGELYDELEVGDLLEIQRKGFTHWAVYVGWEKIDEIWTPIVIQRAVPANANKKSLFASSLSEETQAKLRRAVTFSKSSTHSIGEILLSSIEEVVGDDPVRINNGLDKKLSPKSPVEIATRAKYFLENADSVPRYHLLTNNCQHFATRCRYGVATSCQIGDDAAGKVGGSLGGVVGSFALRFAAIEFALPALGLTLSGPVGWAAAGIGAAVSIGVPIAVHAVQSSRRRKGVKTASTKK